MHCSKRKGWDPVMAVSKLAFNCQNVIYCLDVVLICSGRVHLKSNLIRPTAARNSKIYFQNLIPLKFFILLTLWVACSILIIFGTPYILVL